MKVGVPREIKSHEYRVGLVPASVRELVAREHEVIVERGAGGGIGAPDEAYRAAGARIAQSSAEVFADAELLVKVKEPLAEERALLRPGQVLFTYLHLAPDPDQARDLLASGCVAIAYETVTSSQGTLPLLTPMSEVAGRMAIQVGMHYLERPHSGPGILLPGVPGVPPGKVTILGAGVVGSSAAMIAAGIGAEVLVLDCSVEPLRRIDLRLGGRAKTVVATRDAIEEHVTTADIVVGAVLVAGARAPRLVTRALVERMRRGAVLVDVAIDQGGCFETSRPTTHADPVFAVAGVTHYCVPNMPGAVPRTSATALNNATLPFVLKLADLGWKAALQADPHLRHGLSICNGKVTYAAVAEALGRPLADPLTAIAG
ncbi:MAG: alanine dehydrogenase [Burkholderiales bacterium]|nr:alanine dehydrogenase [Burkholderiales bacterium]